MVKNFSIKSTTYDGSLPLSANLEWCGACRYTAEQFVFGHLMADVASQYEQHVERLFDIPIPMASP